MKRKLEIHRLRRFYSMRVAVCGADVMGRTNFRKVWNKSITCRSCWKIYENTRRS